MPAGIIGFYLFLMVLSSPPHPPCRPTEQNDWSKTVPAVWARQDRGPKDRKTKTVQFTQNTKVRGAGGQRGARRGATRPCQLKGANQKIKKRKDREESSCLLFAFAMAGTAWKKTMEKLVCR